MPRKRSRLVGPRLCLLAALSPSISAPTDNLSHGAASTSPTTGQPPSAASTCGNSFYELFTSAATFDLSNTGFTMIFTGSGYVTVPSVNPIVIPSGGATTLALGDDGQAVVTTSSPLPTCSGLTTSLTICANGFVSAGNGNGTSPTPSVAAMLTAPQTAWWSWHDYDPSAPNSGQVKYEEIGNVAYVTWDGVFDKGTTGPGSTFQFQFDLATGNVTFAYAGMSLLGNAHLVGYSAGGPSSDPGSIDLSATVPSTIAVACTDSSCSCAGSLITNGDFTAGLVAGPMQSGGAVTSWSRLTGDPNVIGNGGCTTNGCVQMWGNRTTGDSIRQVATAFLPNHTYRIKFCHRFVADGSSAQTSVRFRISATANGNPTLYPSSSNTYVQVCRTPATSSPAWIDFEYDWTPTAAVANLTINAENDLVGTLAADMSWGEIDDLCIVEVPFYAAFVFDRSDEMIALQNNGSSRAANSLTAATAPLLGDMAVFFAEHPLAKVQVYEFLGTAVNTVGGPGAFYTSAVTAQAAASSLSQLVSGKPLAHALCTATNGLVALDPNAHSSQRKLFLYCCGGDDGSDTASCRGVLPDATDGNRCAQMPASTSHPYAFSTGSWQEAVCSIVHNDIELHAYYWDDFFDTVPQADFIAALCDLTGGTLYRTWDSSTGPVVNPWCVQGVGCNDFHGTRLSMHHDGIPQVGETIQIGCRTSSALPYILGVGFQNTSISGYQLPLDLASFGAPGCSLYTSWDVTDSFVLWSGMRAFPIPPVPGLVGLSLYWQGLQPHLLNNTLGIATSNLLKVNIAP